MRAFASRATAAPRSPPLRRAAAGVGRGAPAPRELARAVWRGGRAAPPLPPRAWVLGRPPSPRGCSSWRPHRVPGPGCWRCCGGRSGDRHWSRCSRRVPEGGDRCSLARSYYICTRDPRVLGSRLSCPHVRGFRPRLPPGSTNHSRAEKRGPARPRAVPPWRVASATRVFSGAGEVVCGYDRGSPGSWQVAWGCRLSYALCSPRFSGLLPLFGVEAALQPGAERRE